MRLLIFISILLSVMYATNPTTSNFSSFVADRISEKAREEGAKEDLSKRSSSSNPLELVLWFTIILELILLLIQTKVSDF